MRFVCAALCCAIVAVAGCGGRKNETQGKGPASVVPADAAAYLDVSVRPKEKQREPMRRALGRLLGVSDPGPTLRGLIGRGLEMAGWRTGYARGVAPWVGGQVAAFVTSFPRSNLTLVFTTRDRARALAAARQAGMRPGTFGIVRRFLVASTTRTGYRASVDAVERSLASTDRFDEALHTAGGGRVALGYVDSRAAFDALAARRALTGADKARLRRRLGDLVSSPVTLALRPAEDVTALSADVSYAPITPASALPRGSTKLLGRAPADSIVALGVANIGDFLRHQIEQTDAAGVEAVRLGHRLGGPGFDFDRDIFGWLDDSAAFVGGNDLGNLKGAVSFDSSDKDQSREAAQRLAAKAPAGVLIGARGERVIVANDRRPFAWALHPGDQRVSHLGRFKTADANLGYALSGFLSVPRALRVLASSPLGASSLYHAALPYLRRVPYLALGWGSIKGRDRIRVMAGTYAK
jgi:hypothetical protein